jgi:hypothetical protein
MHLLSLLKGGDQTSGLHSTRSTSLVKAVSTLSANSFTFQCTFYGNSTRHRTQAPLHADFEAAAEDRVIEIGMAAVTSFQGS